MNANACLLYIVSFVNKTQVLVCVRDNRLCMNSHSI